MSDMDDWDVLVPGDLYELQSRDSDEPHCVGRFTGAVLTDVRNPSAVFEVMGRGSQEFWAHNYVARRRR